MEYARFLFSRTVNLTIFCTLHKAGNGKDAELAETCVATLSEFGYFVLQNNLLHSSPRGHTFTCLLSIFPSGIKLILPHSVT